MKKILLSLFLAVTMLSGMTATAFAAPTSESDFEYSFSADGTEVCIEKYIGTASEVVIPDTIEGKPVTDIGYYVFDECSNLTAINVNENNAYFCSIDGVLFDKEAKNLICYPFGKSGAYTCPNTVISFRPFAFKNCESLTNITIPNSVTAIEHHAFSGCINLKNIVIPESVERVEFQAFVGCESLESITILGNTSEFCDHWGMITVQDSFWGCNNLKAINVSEDNEYYCSIDGVLYNKDLTRIITYPHGKSGDFTIPDSVTDIGCNYYVIFNNDDYTTFWGCKNLTAINVDEGNANYCSIDGVLFNKEATRLITYPGGRTGDYTVPDGVTEIDFAFADCVSLTSIAIPESVIRIFEIYGIDGTIFWNSDNLAVIYGVPGSYAESFANENGIPFKDIAEKPISYGDFGYVYDAQHQITIKTYTGTDSEVVIPEAINDVPVTRIGERAFANCAGLTSVTIPESVTEISANVFDGCDNLTICGVPGSYAESFANENGIPFKDITEEPTTEEPTTDESTTNEPTTDETTTNEPITNEPTTTKPDDSDNNNPNTGDNGMRMIVAIFALSALALGVAGCSMKKTKA